ncbi:MAG: acetyl-CoA C-acetyltransferase [Phycisphaerales bacterium]
MSDPSTTPVILAAKRTPIGKFFGALSTTPATKLGSYAIKAAMDATPGLKADEVDECIMGHVIQAGCGQNPARQAGLGAGLPETLNAITINKVCGSGLASVMMAAQSIRAGDNALVIAGGQENMTMAPHLAHVRAGVKYGNTQFIDSMANDGLACAFEGCPMGDHAEWTANEFGITREEQDAFAAESQQKAEKAQNEGWFDEEIVPLTGEQIGNRKDPSPAGGCSKDEGIRPGTTKESLAALRPAFRKDGVVTAGNASTINDGAAACVVASLEQAERMGAKPLATIRAYHTSGVHPHALFTAPAYAVPTVIEKAGLTLGDIDLFELNEAFASQSLHNINHVDIPHEKVNVAGGAIALGHPIGASGTRVLVTLLHNMVRLDAKRGVAALCLGGGNAVAMVVER